MGRHGGIERWCRRVEAAEAPAACSGEMRRRGEKGGDGGGAGASVAGPPVPTRRTPASILNMNSGIVSYYEPHESRGCGREQSRFPHPRGVRGRDERNV